MAALRHFSKQLITRNFNVELNPTCNYVLCNRFLSFTPKDYGHENDPAPVFFNKAVQSLLKSLTRLKLDKVFRKRHLGEKKLSLPEVKFLTEDELQEVMNESTRKADELLQMPPAVKVRDPIDTIYSKDPALQGLETSKHVFTDVTFGVSNNVRLIAIREPGGTLRAADWSVRDRINQIYFPTVGRKIKTPLMFKDDYMKSLLARNEFEFILDTACVQFEPEDAEYQKITSVTYQYVNDNNKFELLRSTRHFGSLTFFLTWFKMIDNLLLELIETSHIDEAKTLLKLYGEVHNVKFETDELDSIEKYITEYASKRAPLELALQTYKDLEKQRKELEIGIKKAHGLG